MVNLPTEEDLKKTPSNADLVQRMYNRLREHYREGRLTDLEELAEVTANQYSILLFSRPDLLQLSMNYMRGVFNLEFKLACDRCNVPCNIHFQDEISAPER